MALKKSRLVEEVVAETEEVAVGIEEVVVARERVAENIDLLNLLS